MKNRAKWFAAGLFLIVAVLAVHLALFSGVAGDFQAGFAGRCSAVRIGGGTAGIQIDRGRGVAYLATLDRAAMLRGESVNGTVMLLDLNLAEPAARAAMAYDPSDFRPGALSLFVATAAPARLFVLSDRPDGSRAVEIADQDSGGAFVPREAIVDPAFTHAVALAAVGPRQFYLADDDSEPGLLARWWASLAARRPSTLLFYDGARTRVVARGLGAPAGIGLSPGGTQLYVSDSLTRQLLVYRREPASGELMLESSTDLDTAPDAIDVGAQGVVWIAAHPKLREYLSHRGDPTRRAVTQVVRFEPGAKRLTPAYGNDGTQLSAGSVAAAWRDEFLVGASLDSKVLICKTNP